CRGRSQRRQRNRPDVCHAQSTDAAVGGERHHDRRRRYSPTHISGVPDSDSNEQGVCGNSTQGWGRSHNSFASHCVSAYIAGMSPGTPPNSSAHPSHVDQELAILTEIGALVSSTLELRDAFQKVMQIISDKLDMHRGTLVLLDESTGRLRTEAAIGLGLDEIE